MRSAKPDGLAYSRAFSLCGHIKRGLLGNLGFRASDHQPVAIWLVTGPYTIPVGNKTRVPIKDGSLLHESLRYSPLPPRHTPPPF